MWVQDCNSAFNLPLLRLTLAKLLSFLVSVFLSHLSNENHNSCLFESFAGNEGIASGANYWGSVPNSVRYYRLGKGS